MVGGSAMTITRSPGTATTGGDVDVLLREAKRRSRLRRSTVAAVLAAVAALVLVLKNVFGPGSS